MKLSPLCGFVLAGTVMLAPVPAVAQEDTRAAKLDALFELLESNNKFMGTVAVSKDGRIVFHKQCGIHVANAGQNQRPDQETQYRIGSITKMFTAVMIMQLVEEERLSLDTKLSEFFPDLANADQISIRQMLGHQSGLGSFTDDPTYRAWHTEEKTREKLMEIVSRQPKKFEPGARTEYSNTNYVLLGFVIEDLTRSSYAEQLQTRICRRIDLEQTAYMTQPSEEANVAASFRWSDEKWSPADVTDPSIPHGAGAIMSTAADLTRFIEALFDGKLLSEASLKEMTPSAIGMGQGLFAFPFGGKRAFGHNGGIDGFQSNLGHFVDDGVSVAIIGNGINYSLNNVLIGVLSIVFEQPYELPDFDEANVSEDVLKSYLGIYSRVNFPLKLTFTLNDGKLSAQGTGQPAFPLTASSETEFRSDAVGAVMTFSESNSDSGFDTMVLEQGGMKLEFRKE